MASEAEIESGIGNPLLERPLASTSNPSEATSNSRSFTRKIFSFFMNLMWTWIVEPLLVLLRAPTPTGDPLPQQQPTPTPDPLPQQQPTPIPDPQLQQQPTRTPKLYLSPEMKEKLHDLEMKRMDLYKQEMALDARLDDIVSFSTKHHSTYIGLMGAGSTVSTLALQGRSLFAILATVALTFFMWSGISFVTSLKKLGKTSWESQRITRARAALRREAAAFMVSVQDPYSGILGSGFRKDDAEEIMNEIIKSLDDETGSFKTDHLYFLVINFFGSFASVIMVCIVAYLIRKK